MTTINDQNELKKPGAADITPETKVGKLLNDFPELEEKLFELSPSFKKLRNPFLRKTIGRVATLRQAAEVGKISLGMMINTLRKTAGLSELTDIAEESSSDAGAAPAWVKSSVNIQEFDARPIIEAGEHPMNEVIQKVNELEPDELLKLITPFVPAPLIEIVKGQGFQGWSEIIDDDTANTYFKK